MKLHVLDSRQMLPLTLDETWAFFADPRNLARITPPGLRMELTCELPERIYAGLLISYRVRPLFRVAVRWLTEITHVEEPLRFVDEQRLGPYRFWQHQHHFRAVDGGVEMRDLLHYALPRGGGPLRRVLVAPRLREIFAYRREVLERTFGAWHG